MTAKRIQVRRLKGWRMPKNAVYVGRPSKWGNPFRVGQWKDYTATDAVRDYKLWMMRHPGMRSCENVYGKPFTAAEIRAELKGKDLGCWCRLDQTCHADYLLEVANSA